MIKAGREMTLPAHASDIAGIDAGERAEPLRFVPRVPGLGRRYTSHVQDRAAGCGHSQRAEIGPPRIDAQAKDRFFDEKHRLRG